MALRCGVWPLQKRIEGRDLSGPKCRRTTACRIHTEEPAEAQGGQVAQSGSQFPEAKAGHGGVILPRNFLGGLSRSPAAGSTTQRSSTNLGDKAAQSEGKKCITSACLSQGRDHQAMRKAAKETSSLVQSNVLGKGLAQLPKYGALGSISDTSRKKGGRETLWW